MTIKHMTNLYTCLFAIIMLLNLQEVYAQTTETITQFQIAFTSDRDGTEQIYLMNLDGSNVSLMPMKGYRPRFNYSSVYSPVSKRLSFVSIQDLGFGSQINTMKLDGSGILNVPLGYNLASMGGWSPDGTKLVFSSDTQFGTAIFSMNADGSSVMQLTADHQSNYNPDWSPDGTRIVFVSVRDGNSEIYTMNFDGSHHVRISSTSSEESGPRWSPDGSKLVFASNRNGGNYNIFVMNSDGSNIAQLTNSTGVDIEPAWSPDGTRIVFTSDRDGNAEIYVMNIDGSQQTRLTYNAISDAAPSWIPIQQSQTGTGLRGQYFDASNFTVPKFFRLNASVDYNWGTLSPDAALAADTFSVRWTGKVEPLYSEAITFYVTHNDGARLWVNGQPMINNWTNTTNAVTDSGTITLAAGVKTDIVLEYYDNTGSASVKLEWQSARQARQVIPSTQLYPPEGWPQQMGCW